jgi:hypothetical protein
VSVQICWYPGDTSFLQLLGHGPRRMLPPVPDNAVHRLKEVISFLQPTSCLRQVFACSSVGTKRAIGFPRLVMMNCSFPNATRPRSSDRCFLASATLMLCPLILASFANHHGHLDLLIPKDRQETTTAGLPFGPGPIAGFVKRPTTGLHGWDHAESDGFRYATPILRHRVLLRKSRI